jgi:antitoxin component of RelBE/YafQ-DinJ toxin-antitoxin module
LLQHFSLERGWRLWQHAGMSKDTIIKLRIAQADKEAWEACAKLEGMTLSQWVRYIVGPVAGCEKT